MLNTCHLYIYIYIYIYIKKDTYKASVDPFYNSNKTGNFIVLNLNVDFFLIGILIRQLFGVLLIRYVHYNSKKVTYY